MYYPDYPVPQLKIPFQEDQAMSMYIRAIWEGSASTAYFENGFIRISMSIHLYPAITRKKGEKHKSW